ncbi:MAG TPA: DUF6263 family protein [Chitinophagaceae bacterium]|nr:DUF6263 family protein [Chitinophagaceae bacterium]
MTKGIYVSLLMLATVAGSAHAQKISVTKGQKLETVTTTKMSMEVMGQSMDNESTATSNIEVKDVTADGYLFTNTIRRMTMKGSTMGQDISFDSDKKEDMDGQIGQALKDQIGNPQEIQVDKKGKVSGLQEAADKKAGAGMAGMMGMSGDIAKGQPYPILIQLPANAVKPGDSWTDSSGSPATIKTVTVYTLKSVSADGAMVSFNGTLTKNGTIEQNGMEIQMDMTGTTKGEATYDSNTGLLKTTTSTSDVKGNLGIMGQSAPLTGTITANIVAKKL